MTQQITKVQAENLYRTHYLDLFKLALMLTRSQALAEDIVSETFLKAFEHYHQYTNDKPIKPWLNKILINTLRQFKRKQKRWLLTAETPEIVDLDNFLTQFYTEQKDQELWALVEGLKPKSREVIILHYYESLTLPEVASMLEIPLGTCKSRLNTALNQLRRITPMELNFCD